MYKIQENCRCSLCGDRDQTINHMIIEVSKLPQKEYKTRHNLMGKVIHSEIVQYILIWPYVQMVYAKPCIGPGEWDAQTPLGFWDTNG